MPPPVPVIVMAPLPVDWMVLPVFQLTPKLLKPAPEPPPVPPIVMPPAPLLVIVLPPPLTKTP